MPRQGPCEAGELPCRVGIDHWRERKTGPRFPLAVCRCRAHGLGFTLYPPGHLPYGRAPLEHRAPAGPRVEPEKGEAGDPFRGTLLSAASEAAAGHWWPVQGAQPLGAEGVLSTQRRRLRWLVEIVAVDPDTPDGLREKVAQAIGVPLLTLRDAAREQEGTDGAPMQRRGRAVVRVLERTAAASRSLTEALAASGYLVGLWGSPLALSRRGSGLRPRTQLRRGPPRAPG